MNPYLGVVSRVKEIVASYQGNEHPYVIFDIDETLITGREYSGRLFFMKQARGELKPIEEMIDLHNWLIGQGISTALITARKSHLEKVTVDNLTRAGLKGKTSIYLMPGRMDKIKFKSGIRRQIYNNGHIILANIGDRHTDLDGGYCEHTFILPSTY